MFRVFNKKTLDTYIVYAIRDDACGYPQFLIYDKWECGVWKWMSAKNFERVEEEE